MKTTTARRAPNGIAQATNQAVAVYARVSTEDQAEKESVQNQLDFLRRYVDLHGLPVAGEYVDDGISGRLALGDRPEGRRLLIDAEAGQFGTVLFYNLKRLGRRLQVILDVEKALDQRGVAIRSGTEPIDTSTPTGKFVFHLLGSLSEFDTDERAEVTGRGRNRAAGDGKYTGGPIPLGYELDADKRLVPSQRIVAELDMTEADMVRTLFRRIVSGETTVNAETVRLTALGVPRRQRYAPSKRYPEGRTIERDGHWANSTLLDVLHNPLYKGAGVFGNGAGVAGAGEVARPVPALVDAETWQRAQEALRRNKRLSTKNAKHYYLLRGLIRCAACGATYIGVARGEHRRYRCSGQSKHRSGTGATRCPGKELPADWLEDALWQECRQFILNPGDALAEAQRKLRARMAGTAGHETRRRALLAALAGKEAERERVLTLYRKGKISDQEAEAQLDDAAREAAALRSEVEALRAQASLVEAQEDFLTDIAALMARFRDELAEIDASGDHTRKRAFIEAYVRQITVESRRLGPRQVEADVRIALRFQSKPTANGGQPAWQLGIGSESASSAPGLSAISTPRHSTTSTTPKSSPSPPPALSGDKHSPTASAVEHAISPTIGRCWRWTGWTWSPSGCPTICMPRSASTRRGRASTSCVKSPCVSRWRTPTRSSPPGARRG